MAAFKWGCGLSFLLFMVMAPVQVNAQTITARDLYPKHIPDEGRGVIVFQFKELEGVSLRCNFKYGPRNIDCTNGYELYTETLRPGRHVMDVTGIRVATGQAVGKVTVYFIVDEKMTFSIKASVRMEDVPKVCFSATRPALYKCRLDDGEWGDCTSCKAYPSLCPGSYQVQIRATSRINPNVTTATTQSFKIGFDGDFVNALLTYATENRRIRMCFNATREARYECRIGRGTWQSCTSCHSFSNLCPGHYFTEVRATSVHCPRISSTYEKNVVLGPSLEISRAGMDIDCNRGEYALESNIPSMWRCRVNSDSWHSCRNGMALPRLTVGTHTVTVEARSSCNQSEKVQTRFVARVPDGVSIDNCQVKSVGESLTATFSTCSLTQTFCKIDNGNYEACSSPYSIPSNVRPGPHRIHIKAELNGRELARHQCPFFKEMVLRINGSTEVTGHSVGACFQSNYPARFECRVDSNSWESCTSCAEKNELCPGRHQFAVRGTARGNSSVTASTSFPFSTTDRNIAVDVTSEVTGSSAEVCFTASRKSTFECSIDRRAWQSCTSCVNYDDICAGQHTVMVRAASRICSSVSGRSETRFNIQSDLDITEAGMEVNCNNGVYSLATNRPARLRCRMNAGTWRTCSNGQSVNNMAAGVYSVEVEAALQCNPAIKATKTFEISVPGNVKVGAIQASKYEGGRMVITFDECKAAVYYCALDSGAETKCSSPYPITAVLSPGSHTVTVTARAKSVSLISDDSAGNDLDSETVVVDIGLELRCSVVVKGPKPILIVPGLMGSQLSVKVKSLDHCYTGWGNSYKLFWINPFKYLCLHKLKLRFKKGRFYNKRKVRVRVYKKRSHFGRTKPVECIDGSCKYKYLKSFVKYFAEKGYGKGTDIRAAAYDWRLSPYELKDQGYFHQVKALIETMFDGNDQKRITIAAHSYGGVVMLYFLRNEVDQKWKDKYIKAFIPLGSPFGGATKIIGALVYGELPIDFIKSKFIKNLVKKKILLPVIRTFPSLYFLAPRPDVFQDKVLTKRGTSSYTAKNYTNILTYRAGFSMYKATQDHNKNYHPGNPGVSTYCMYGTGKATPDLYEKRKNHKLDVKKDTRGDGTVDGVSLEECWKWSKTVTIFPGVNHKQILTDKAVLNAISDIVSA